MIVVSTRVNERTNELLKKVADSMGTSRDAILKKLIADFLAPILEADKNKAVQG